MNRKARLAGSVENDPPRTLGQPQIDAVLDPNRRREHRIYDERFRAWGAANCCPKSPLEIVGTWRNEWLNTSLARGGSVI
jgi:hypothetical protein